MTANHEDAIVGSLLGTAVGDAIGLPYEGLSRRRAQRMLGPATRHRFFFRRGMVSDDTEHACMVAQALSGSGLQTDQFGSALAWRFRIWFLGLPAGIGFATLRAILKLWFGFGPGKSGVFSAGNGPAMRAPVIGAAVSDPVVLQSLVRACTRITHTDPKAESGALAVALAANLAQQGGPADGRKYLDALRTSMGDVDVELISLLERAAASADQGISTNAFADELGLQNGVGGYMYHTVPVVIHAWLRHPTDFRRGVSEVVECGGDADTTAAILGGIIGAGVGRGGIPDAWLSGLIEWPRTVGWMERLGRTLASDIASGNCAIPPRLNPLAVLMRNLFFLVVVLFHGFRRLLPPY